MPTPASRRLRHVLTAALAVGVLGVGYAGIASARSSSDEADSRLTAAAPRDALPDSVPSEEQSAEPSLPLPSATTSPSPARPSAKASIKASTSASARPSRTAGKPATQPARKPASKRPTTAPTKKPPAPGNTGSAPSGGSATITAIIRLVNAERAEAGCGKLAGETRLHRAAQKHSQRQATQNKMSHQLPGEAAMGDRVSAEGYRWGGVAENVAAGYRTPADVMTGWMNSAGHKANILNCGYKHIGVGVAKSGDGTLYWTQNFASPL